MHLSTLLTIKQDHILEKKKKKKQNLSNWQCIFTMFHVADELKDNASFMPTQEG